MCLAALGSRAGARCIQYTIARTILLPLERRGAAQGCATIFIKPQLAQRSAQPLLEVLIVACAHKPPTAHYKRKA
jgi:hypothetical protein